MDSVDKSTTILLVEDSPDDAALLRLTLFDTPASDAGRYQLVSCVRLGEALSILARGDSDTPDVLLLDLQLPDSSGLETLRRVVDAAPSVPVVVMTSHDDEDIASQAVKMGAQDYLVKGRETVDRGALIRGLRRAIERHQLQSSLRSALDDARHTEAELRRALGERNRLEEELRHTRRLEALGRLAGGVAHDFNNQLTVVLSSASLLQEELDPDSPLQRDVEEIQGAAQSAALLTRQLLAFGRKQLLRPQNIDVNVVVERMIGMLERLIGDDIQLSLALASGIPRVFADPAQIEQVVVNLVMNARDAMSSGGRLTIHTRQSELGDLQPPDLGETMQGEYVVLTIEDSGAGMDDEVLSRIFEPFFSTKGIGEASGLGLSTVYGIIKQTGGDVRVRSKPGDGSVFEVLLPQVPAATTPSSPSMPRYSAEGGGGAQDEREQTILLVEDEPAVRRSAARLLRRRGYTVIAAEDPRMALELCTEHPVDLLLTDMMMPGMTGADLAHRVLESQSEIKVLFMSGYSEAELIPGQEALAGSGFVEKPYSPKELVDSVRRLLAT